MSDVHKSGWMKKKSFLRGNWINRYYVLKKGELLYYKNLDLRSPRGIISVKNIRHIVHDVYRGGFLDEEAFGIVYKIDHDYETKLILRVDDIDDKIEWCNAIEKLITKK